MIFFIYFFSKKFFIDLSKKSIEELNLAEEYLYQGMFNKALNKDKIESNNLGFLGIYYKYPFTSSGNISKFYAGICYYKLEDYENCINILDKFNSKEDILSSIKYGIIGDAYSQMNNKEKSLENYIKASAYSNITTPLYYYKIAIIYLSLNKYKESKFFLEKIENKYPFFLYKDNVEKYITFTENKLRNEI
ncbi:tetratricopeptide repeat protein [Blattabacterium cuenoti]|uniref:tetratricopeptide repeat protein n=1 Tax=Blattabacterium cuenoti TaxID=1653831 RepID=UPI001EEAB7D1|nr:tetratricopeptide repeat protein [Blattabacterium cuenoti]